MGDLDDLLKDVATVASNKKERKNKSSEEIKLNYCADIVLSQDNKKYILGTNQLFPIYTRDILNGGRYDVQMYLYSALSWHDMLYTDYGAAVRPDEDPDATLGYNCGVRIFNYRGGTPCVAKSRHERTLTVDEWCRLTCNSVYTQKVFPKLWVENNGGHEFWTPNKGIIRALPVNIPMTLETIGEFKRKGQYASKTHILMTRLISMLYSYMRDNDIDHIYVGYENNLVADPETKLIDAYKWSANHCRRVGEIQHDHLDLFGEIASSSIRKLMMAVNASTFSEERVFA
jgi:hypothetical protein